MPEPADEPRTPQPGTDRIVIAIRVHEAIWTHQELADFLDGWPDLDVLIHHCRLEARQP